MAKKNWIFIKRGLSEDPKHRAAMGECVWLYMHIIDRADWETGIAFDWKDEQEAAEMSMPVRTLREQRRKLDELDYISCKQKQYSQDVIIKRWIDPRNYSGKVLNQGDIGTEPQESGQGYTQGYTQGSSQDGTPTSDSYSLSEEFLRKAGLEWLILSGKQITQEIVDNALLEKKAKDDFESVFGFGTLPWSSNNDWTKFEKFIIRTYKQNPAWYADYVAWREDKHGGKYKAYSNKKIRETPAQFMDTGYPEYEASKMCRKTDEQRPEYKPIVRKEENTIPNPLLTKPAALIQKVSESLFGQSVEMETE